MRQMLCWRLKSSSYYMLRPFTSPLFDWRQGKRGRGLRGLADISTIVAIIESCVAFGLDELRFSSSPDRNFAKWKAKGGSCKNKRVTQRKWKLGNGGSRSLEKGELFTGKLYVPHLWHLMETKSQPIWLSATLNGCSSPPREERDEKKSAYPCIV